MSTKTDEKSSAKLKRREFLATAAIPIVAAMAPATVTAQRTATNPSSQDRIRVGIIGAGANVRAVQLPAFRRVPECEVLAVANLRGG